jgi:hypothetical protein
MATRTAWLATFVMLFALADSVHAQQPAGDPKQEPRHAVGAELVAINQCVREVREARPGSAFDAHIGTLGTMRYVSGTDAEIAAFKRCMETKGFPVDRK